MKIKNIFKKKIVAVDLGDRAGLLRLKKGTSIDIFQQNNFVNGNGFPYASLLHAFSSDTEAIILDSDGHKSPLEVGDRFSIVFKSHLGIYKDTVEVTEKLMIDNLPYVKVSFIGTTTRQQRRANPRLDENMEFEFDIVETPVDDSAATRGMSVIQKLEREQKKKEFEDLKFKKYLGLFYDKIKSPVPEGEEKLPLPYLGETLDVSVGGMRFLSSHRLNTGYILGVKLEIEKNQVLCIGKVTFCDNLAEYNNQSEIIEVFDDDTVRVNEDYKASATLKYLYKCVFECISDKDKETLQKYVVKGLNAHLGSGRYDEE